MTKTSLLFCALLLFMANVVSAQELLLKVEHVGFKDVPEAELEEDEDLRDFSKSLPQDQQFWFIETIVVPGTPFKAKYVCGGQTRWLKGTVKKGKNGNWMVDLNCGEQTIIGKDPDLEGSRRRFNSNVASSSAPAELDKPQTFGGGVMSRSSFDPHHPEVEGKKMVSRAYFVMTLTKYDPENDDN